MRSARGAGPAGLGWATEWLHDGRLLLTGETLLRREPDGSFAEHADLTNVFTRGCSEIVVDGRPDGSVRQVAGDLAFPNGMVISPDNVTLIVANRSPPVWLRSTSPTMAR